MGGLLSTVSFSEGMTSEEGWILCEPLFQGQSRKNWSVMGKKIEGLRRQRYSEWSGSNSQYFVAIEWKI